MFSLSLISQLTVTRGSSGFGFSLSDQTPVGICHVDSDSSAERAGLRVGDRIIEVQGEDLSNADMKHVAAIIRCVYLKSESTRKS